MKSEELIIKINDDLAKEEQEATKKVIKNVYKELEKGIKNDAYILIDITDYLEDYSYKIQSKILANVTKYLKESGYYVVNSHVYLNYDSYKKNRILNRILYSVVLFLIAISTLLVYTSFFL